MENPEQYRIAQLEENLLQLASWCVEAKTIGNVDYDHLKALIQQSRVEAPFSDEEFVETSMSKRPTEDLAALVRLVVETLRAAENALDQSGTFILRNPDAADAMVLHAVVLQAQRECKQALAELRERA